jgi:hypothetical protein
MVKRMRDAETHAKYKIMPIKMAIRRITNMPSSKGYVRDYAQERVTEIKRGESGVGHNSSDAKRKRARRAWEKENGKLLAGQTLDHTKPIKSGGGNALSNLSIKSLSENSSAGGKMGSKAGKTKGGKKGRGKQDLLAKRQVRRKGAMT